MLSPVFNACHVNNRVVPLVNEAEDVLALAKCESTYGSLHLLLRKTFSLALPRCHYLATYNRWTSCYRAIALGHLRCPECPRTFPNSLLPPRQMLDVWRGKQAKKHTKALRPTIIMPLTDKRKCGTAWSQLLSPVSEFSIIFLHTLWSRNFQKLF